MVDPSSNRADGLTSAFPLPGGPLAGQGLGGDVPWTSPPEATTMMMTGERKDNADYFGGGEDRTGGVGGNLRCVNAHLYHRISPNIF